MSSRNTPPADGGRPPAPLTRFSVDWTAGSIFPDAHGMWVEVADVDRLLEERDKELFTLRARAIVAEHHKLLDRLGKSSYQEVVEQELRIKLAETEVRAERLEAEITALRASCVCGAPQMMGLHASLEALRRDAKPSSEDVADMAGDRPDVAPVAEKPHKDRFAD